jgi:antitoxin HigA-1
MPMKNPCHPGDVVATCLEELGLSVAEAAKGLGVTRQALHRVVSGKAAVSPEMAMRLSKAFGSTPDTWLGMQSAYDLAQLRDREFDVKRYRRAS